MTIQRADLLLTRVIFLLLLLSPYIAASNSWHASSANWTQHDLDRLLNDSPWALQIEATMDDPADVRHDTPAPLPGAAEAGLAGSAVQGAKPRWDGGVSRNRMGHLATIPVTVRWDSAAIIQQALQRQHPAATPEMTAAQPSSLIITVIGLLPAGQASKPDTRSKSDSSEDPKVRSGEETLEWFMTNSRLLKKGRVPLQPKNVRIDPATGAVHLFFDRSPAFVSDKHDVLFVTRFGAMNVEARFHPKDMRVDGRSDF